MGTVPRAGTNPVDGADTVADNQGLARNPKRRSMNEAEVKGQKAKGKGQNPEAEGTKRRGGEKRVLFRFGHPVHSDTGPGVKDCETAADNRERQRAD